MMFTASSYHRGRAGSIRGRQLAACVLAALPAVVATQSLDSSKIPFGETPRDMWPTYYGDYSGRRYSPLDQINQSNVRNLSLAWVYRANPSSSPGNVGGFGPATGSIGGGGAIQIKATPLMVDGVLFFTAPDHVWAVNAYSGEEIWHYSWRATGGLHIGNRGLGMWKDTLFFGTPDNYLVALDAQTGKERWNRQIASVKQDYFTTVAPLVIRNTVIVGVGGDFLDVPGFLEGREPESGEVKWRWFTTPRPGEPGSETWPGEEAMTHGGGMTWLPPTYDPALNLLYLGTGNPNPVLVGQTRAGDNLWTCSIVAIDPDTGKMKWYYQVSPHDTHDWDAAQTPVLVDGDFGGRPRKLLLQAARNGFYFVLDRTNGEHLLTTKLIDTANWYSGINAKGQPIPNPEKESKLEGVLVSPNTSGATNWHPPSFNPVTGLHYVGTMESYTIFYKTDPTMGAQGYSAQERSGGNVRGMLKAIDYKTGKTRWTFPISNGSQGLLSTAGQLLFASDGRNDFIAFNAATGTPLWHTKLPAEKSNAPITYMLGGRQFIVVAAGDELFAFDVNN
jgi:acido-empty-quinoprotein group A